MKRILTFLAVMSLLASCGQPKGHRCNTAIADYLYGVEYDDYDFDACKRYFDGQYIPAGGCSEVRRGNFIGRNLDWYINRNASAIIKVNSTGGHYASIGIVGCFPQFTDEVARTGGWDDVYNYLPFKTEDGINECGLYVGVNVMPTGETSFDRSTWRPHEYGLGAAHTNPGAGMSCAVNYLPRILLDRASSVAEAKEIIESIDWTEPVDYPHPGETQSFHWLICDPGHSVVLEFMDNRPHYTEAASVRESGFGTVMTNFTNCLWEKGISQINGIGYERFDILRECYSDYERYPESFRGMEDLMSQVWFSKDYTIPLDSEDYWLSEAAGDRYPAWTLYKNFGALGDSALRAQLQAEQDAFKDKAGWFTDGCDLWFSTHTSVYDIATRTLRVLAHEGLSGQTVPYEAALADTHFEKPLSGRR